MTATPMPDWPSISEEPSFFINSAIFYNSWLKLGSPPYFAEGLLANAEAESSMDPAAVGDNGTAFNLLQWHIDRVLAILRGAAVDLRTELDIIKIVEAASWELGVLEQDAFKAMHEATNAHDAGIACANVYERSKDPDNRAKRGVMAERWAVFWSSTVGQAILAANPVKEIIGG